jgi:hypothetical protein
MVTRNSVTENLNPFTLIVIIISVKPIKFKNKVLSVGDGYKQII